jgi:hypothetical protein
MVDYQEWATLGCSKSAFASGRIPEAELAEWIREYLAGR